MKRVCLGFLDKWLHSAERKPLVIRGARQVGKTWVVQHLAESQKKDLIEVNFEKQPHRKSLFNSNDPKQIILNLSAVYGDINPEKSILFLDEIQAAPELLAKLRWFAEDMPELPVIAAGSLLEFTLEDHSFSMPVGRINYMHLEPLSFEEFLLAKNKSNLVDYIKKYNFQYQIPIEIHEQLLEIFKEYIIIGGMPQAVNSWITYQSLDKVSQIHNDLLATYRDDFPKYSGKLVVERLDELLTAIPRFLGQKFIYSKVNPEVQSKPLKQALDLICKARLSHKVIGTAANGVPLGAEIQDKYLKIIFLDVGLCSNMLGISLDNLISIKDIDLINKGAISEQVVGQILRTVAPFYIEPSLYYWHRDEKGSNAEIDYIIQHQNKVVPIEVKSGSTGGLKSLHIFMELKKLATAVRINSDLPTITEINTQTNIGKSTTYKLISIPYYLLGEIQNLLKNEASILKP